ncbi:hypothetical protein DNU06_00225 [Putridiphycobacter roseus]|uniref:Methyltransferase FkbM domain-containing protein n=1 Tax=Putridiphycobacter roseus TaxID=2219161 RepID=A0A2W1NK42_9FLAO|nr:FkbM family methyltransferase [Putridiphycobacter roseus]PZE18296.1 hypothetical protein DNU06_00225 [Putridiphycobacter roseus]
MSKTINKIKVLGLKNSFYVLCESFASKLLSLPNQTFKDNSKAMNFFYAQGISDIQFLNNSWQIVHKNSKYKLRNNSSDIPVFNQVVIQKEYLALIDFIKKYESNPKTMVDLGGNIGLTSIYVHSFFPSIQITIVEPFQESFDLMQTNLKNNNINAKCLNNGIWNKTTNLSISTDFRDGKPWSLSVVEEENGPIKSINLQELFPADQIVDILKIDIEGSEFKLFESPEYAASFLSKTKFIAIEIHDDVGDRAHINAILKQNNYEFFVSGELTIGRNTLLTK